MQFQEEFLDYEHFQLLSAQHGNSNYISTLRGNLSKSIFSR